MAVSNVKKWLRSGMLSILVLTSVGVVTPAQAEPMHEFVMSCTYGALAGGLIGAASLAFSDRPGEDMNSVARGASLGLYAGIILGIYVISAIPSEDDAAAAGLTQHKAPAPEPPRFLLLPSLSPKGLDGGSLQVSVLRF